MAQAVQFTKYVGVSPGTTTMTVPVSGLGLGVCPPGYYGEAIMLPGSVAPNASAAPAGTQWLNPYATEMKLNGLRGVMRWDLLILGFGVAFAGVLGYSLYKRKRR